MVILLAGQQKVFLKKLYLSGMKYDVKMSKNGIFVKYVSEAHVK